MKPIVSSLALAAVLGMAHAAVAQQAASGDAAGVDYCRTLVRAYLSQNPVQSSPIASEAMMSDNCASDTQRTTALVKQKLVDHGIDMPKPPTLASGDGTGRSVQ
jgi:hypothetical protein